MIRFRLYFVHSNIFRLSKLWSIAEKSKDEVDLYVFVTAAGKGGTLGRAYVGTVCKTDKVYRRISINRYGIKGKGEAQKNKVAYTAEVIFYLSWRILKESHFPNVTLQMTLMVF